MEDVKGNMKSRGFTLIELLVVVSIISLLLSMVLGTLSEARTKARDSVRTQTVAEYKKAFMLYRAKYGSFPAVNSCVGDADGDGRCSYNDNTTQDAGVVADLLEFFPAGLPGIEPVEDAFLGASLEGLIYDCSGGGNLCSITWALENNTICPGGTPIAGSKRCTAGWQ